MKSFKNMPHMFQESDSLAIKLEGKDDHFYVCSQFAFPDRFFSIVIDFFLGECTVTWDRNGFKSTNMSI